MNIKISVVFILTMFCGINLYSQNTKADTTFVDTKTSSRTFRDWN